jgi:lactonase
VLRLTPDKHLSVVVSEKQVSPGGIAIHKDGRIFVAAMNLVQGTGEIIAVKPDGAEKQTIVPSDAGYMPNDLVFDRDGGLYFTDFRGTSTDPRAVSITSHRIRRPSLLCCLMSQWRMASH